METFIELKKAILENKKLYWNDPQPIDGNDYRITFIEDLSNINDDEYPDDYPIIIQYGEGSEAEVFLFEITEDIHYFEDWVSDMLNSSDYSEFELMCFEEHYQNLLTFEQNTEAFIKHHLVHYDRDTLMNTESGVLYDKITNKIVGIHNT